MIEINDYLIMKIFNKHLKVWIITPVSQQTWKQHSMGQKCNCQFNQQKKGVENCRSIINNNPQNIYELVQFY